MSHSPPQKNQKRKFLKPMKGGRGLLDELCGAETKEICIFRDLVLIM